MDVVTHGLAGGLIARAVAERGPWPIVATAVGGAIAPDLDVLARLWDPLAPITVHRTATHSLMGGLPLALGVAGALRLWSGRASFRSLTVVAYLGLLSHIGLDLLTPFGTAVLWPLEPRRFGLGWLYVIDPIVIGIMLTGLLLALRWRTRPVQVARGALGALMLYILVAGMTAKSAAATFAGLLEAQGITPIRATVVPVFPGPARWLGVAETDLAIYRSRFWVRGDRGAPVAAISKPAMGEPWSLDELPEVRAFKAFARFPWRTRAVDGNDQVVEYRDLAFEDHPWGGPLSLRVRVDPAGAVRAIEFGHRF